MFRLSILATRQSLWHQKARDKLGHFGAMTQVGQNWNQLVLELNGWLVLARELENTLETRDISALETATRD